ncbi:unnamed protein product, partial [Adineta steineri]
FVFNQLEDKSIDPKMMQINLTDFLGGSKARLFIGELWALLASGQSSPDGIPAELIEMKKKELQKRKCYTYLHTTYMQQHEGYSRVQFYDLKIVRQRSIFMSTMISYCMFLN